MVLVKLIEKAAIIPLVERQALTRRVILWCVEAYFGHLGGDVLRGDVLARGVGAGPSLPRPSSNR
jgi:hypothetical protein